MVVTTEEVREMIPVADHVLRELVPEIERVVTRNPKNEKGGKEQPQPLLVSVPDELDGSVTEALAEILAEEFARLRGGEALHK